MTKTYYVTVELSAEEIQALQKAREYVRTCMAHTHPWAVRDAAMVTIGKMVDAAQEHSITIKLSAVEVEALQKALEYVRTHMAGEHPWAVRDAVMVAISKVLITAQEQPPEPQERARELVGSKPIRWNTNIGLIPNHEGMHIRVLAKDIGAITEFVYVVTKDGDGHHFLSTDGTLEGALPFRLVIAWRME